MELSSEETDNGLIKITVKGVCRDSFEGLEVDPLAQLGLENIYERSVLVDLAEVSMLNSSGVGWLLVCHKRFQVAGKRWIIHSVPGMAMNVLRLMRLNEVFDLAKNEDAAIEALNRRESSV